MRKILAFLAALALLSAVSVPALAAKVIDIRSPVSFVSTNPCSGELVDFSGQDHLTSTLTTDSAGGVHYDIYYNLQGVSGVGETTGAKYRFNDAVNLMLSPTSSGTSNELHPLDSEVIGQGTVPNFLVHAVLHVTMNANGSITSSIDSFSATCQ